MKILLDTHVWLFSLQAPERLANRVRKALDNIENEIWLSPVSTWEALILFRKGRLKFEGDVISTLNSSRSHFREAPLTHEIAITSERLMLQHWDPADRFLAATAKVLGLTLATSDENLLELTEITTLSNR